PRGSYRRWANLPAEALRTTRPKLWRRNSMLRSSPFLVVIRVACSGRRDLQRSWTRFLPRSTMELGNRHTIIKLPNHHEANNQDGRTDHRSRSDRIEPRLSITEIWNRFCCCRKERGPYSVFKS